MRKLFVTIVCGQISIANAGENHTDIDLMALGLEMRAKLVSEKTIPGFKADGERTIPGRFVLHAAEDGALYLLDSASGRMWRLQDEQLMPIFLSPAGLVGWDASEDADEGGQK